MSARASPSVADTKHDAGILKRRSSVGKAPRPLSFRSNGSGSSSRQGLSSALSPCLTSPLYSPTLVPGGPSPREGNDGIRWMSSFRSLLPPPREPLVSTVESKSDDDSASGSEAFRGHLPCDTRDGGRTLPRRHAFIHAFSTLGSHLSGGGADDFDTPVDTEGSVSVQEEEEEEGAAGKDGAFFLQALAQLFDAHEAMGGAGDPGRPSDPEDASHGSTKTRSRKSAALPLLRQLTGAKRTDIRTPVSRASGSRLTLPDPRGVICAGYMKKTKELAGGVWRAKYVEVRPGLLVYGRSEGDVRDPRRASVIPLNARSIVAKPLNAAHAQR